MSHAEPLGEHPQRAERRRAPPPAVAASRPIVMSPRSSRFGRPAARRAPRRPPPGSEARPWPGRASTFTWRRTGSGRPGRTSRGDPVEAARELDGIDRLDDVEELDRPAGLVRLERPDEVPAGARHERDLGGRLLDAVLAEDVEAGGDGGPEPLGGRRSC